MVLYQNIIRLITERPSRWWQCLEVFNNSYNKWPNFKSSSCYWYIFHPSGLVKHYWKLVWLVNGNMSISSGWRVIEKPPHAFKIFFDFSPSSFNPRLDDMKFRRAHFKQLGNFLVTLNVLWVFCTDQFVFGPSIQSIERLFVGRFVVAFKSSSKMLSAFKKSGVKISCYCFTCYVIPKLNRYIHLFFLQFIIQAFIK